MSDEPGRKRVYTKDPTIFLAPGERPMYDAMLEHSATLKIAATQGLKEISELLADVGQAVDAGDQAKAEEIGRDTFNGFHKLLAYAFTLGTSFAFDQIAKTMGPQLQRQREIDILGIEKQRKGDS